MLQRDLPRYSRGNSRPPDVSPASSAEEASHERRPSGQAEGISEEECSTGMNKKHNSDI